MSVYNDNLLLLPAELPVLEDDGACDHLAGIRIPSIALPATCGEAVDLSLLPDWVAVFAYPRTGKPGDPPLVADWDDIPGARGCTPQTCGFRDTYDEFSHLQCTVFGLSVQDRAYQKEMVQRLHVPFPVLSDAELTLAHALQLPTLTVGEHVLLKRLAWIAHDGVIRKIFYPVFPPNENARHLLAWLRDHR